VLFLPIDGLPKIVFGIKQCPVSFPVDVIRVLIKLEPQHHQLPTRQWYTTLGLGVNEKPSQEAKTLLNVMDSGLDSPK